MNLRGGGPDVSIPMYGPGKVDKNKLEILKKAGILLIEGHGEKIYKGIRQ